MRRTSRPPNGFTLMEATVALGVFTIGMLGLGGSFFQIVHANAVSQQKQVALLLVQRQLAEFRMAQVGELAEAKGTFDPPFEDYTWEARFVSPSQDLQIADVWIEVKYRSNVAVRLWTQMVVADGS
jgi:Tfp pilus assembly protein PilV